MGLASLKRSLACQPARCMLWRSREPESQSLLPHCIALGFNFPHVAQHYNVQRLVPSIIILGHCQPASCFLIYSTASPGYYCHLALLRAFLCWFPLLVAGNCWIRTRCTILHYCWDPLRRLVQRNNTASGRLPTPTRIPASRAAAVNIITHRVGSIRISICVFGVQLPIGNDK